MTTTNLADFGYRELDMAADLLKEWANGNLPENFYQEDIQLMMNTYSGNVFLTNIDYQVVMMDGSSLEEFFTTPFDCHEGFKSDLQLYYEQNPDDWCPEDIAYLQSLDDI